MNDRLLVLVRHGQSEWNLKNLFTGWKDPDLTELGIEEAKDAGRKLKAQGFKFDIAFTSVLTRAQHTLDLMLAEIGQTGLPTKKNLALNERDYGDLSGLNKDDARKKWGEEQVLIWRRSYDVPPPGGESLKDTLARTLPYYVQEILPCVLRGERMLVAAHGNSLRALIMVLEKLTPENILKRELAPACRSSTGSTTTPPWRPSSIWRRERRRRSSLSHAPVADTALDRACGRAGRLCRRAAPASASCRHSRTTRRSRFFRKVAAIGRSRRHRVAGRETGRQDRRHGAARTGYAAQPAAPRRHQENAGASLRARPRHRRRADGGGQKMKPRRHGRWLLVLDTVPGENGHRLYLRCGLDPERDRSGLRAVSRRPALRHRDHVEAAGAVIACGKARSCRLTTQAVAAVHARTVKANRRGLP